MSKRNFSLILIEYSYSCRYKKHRFRKKKILLIFEKKISRGSLTLEAPNEYDPSLFVRCSEF